ncbi:hypothetical protein K490DRAFT_52420 [Saccharata proteae CBS 121410]|uniref:Frequency clock protein n=1 Tax=Saccharata proteae CBS 121410 TaxID=1314787 RepID=A0A9P4LR33_9PEZI|nr:hypothetical protein K490DRAFT_52420 [Saccharata proteae CBS 121410]
MQHHHHHHRSDTIGTAPSQMSAPQSQRHPRRPPAHRSVSLLHSPGKRTSSGLMSAHSFNDSPSRASSKIPSSDRADLGSSPDSNQPTTTKKLSSGEVSDAGNWFDNENNNARHHNGFVDTLTGADDPPFFLRNESSSSTSPELRQAQSTLRPQSLPHRPALMPMVTDGSSNEDFRSVIDDLTVENKKLKRKLQKYERMHGHPASDERLFEIRIHGLPPHKKHELEETLRKFATTLDDGGSSESANDASTTPPLPAHPTLSSHASTRVADSAYHSISASGQNSTAPSGSGSLTRKPSRTVFKNQQDSIQSYLQDIPAGLLPRQPIAMTERSKKKMVVRRLEQIFSGKGAVGGHQQPQQQQEVAQSAAHADRMELEATTGQQARKEGHREARIMTSKNEERMEIEERSPEGAAQEGATQHLKPNVEVAERDFADKDSVQTSDGNSTPNQRPTRPLDLDPQRAQVPEDNMKYIRHLGFSPPEIENEEGFADGHGWIYLNILINMAQLHTINVTPEFVQEALGEFSSKFEVSTDGRKVRWSGGRGVSSKAADSSPDQAESSANSRSNVKRVGPKRMRIGYSSTEDASSSVPLSDQTSRKRSRKDDLSYTPLFYHREESDEYGSNMEPSSDYDSPPMQANGNSSGFASSGMKTSSSKRRRDDGPIIFYNRARFCTDLSGDRDLQPARNHTDYSSLASAPLGASPDHHQEIEKLKLMDSVRGPLVYVQPKTEQPMDIDTVPGDVELQFPSSPSVVNAASDRQDIDFEVSGLGGVLPGDNFAINVECRQVRIDAPPVPGAVHAGMKPFPNKVTRPQPHDSATSAPSTTSNATIKPFSASVRPIVNKEIISASRKDLPVSILPPPSLLPFDDSSGDADSDTDMSDESDNDEDSTSDIPAPGPQLMNLAGGSASSNDGFDEDDEDDDDDESDDDGSLDFLATAREIDPASIRAKEREYDSNMAERLAEEIPAGSSAATAGGGSGFNSPASMARMNVEEARREARLESGSSQKPALKRARTSDSLVVNGKGDSDDEDETEVEVDNN